jgi:hypothetical protein
VVATYDDRRLWPGTVPPRTGSPARRPGSVRRTTNVDMLRPDGIAGRLVIVGAGRDLVTHRSATPEVKATAGIEVVVDYVRDRTVTAVRVEPDIDGIDRLVGARAGSGFRRAMAEALPDFVASGSITHQLLDEVTPGTLVSGSVLARSGLVHLAAPSSAASHLPVDICAGWQHGGAMLDAVAETGVPLLGWGPPAPDLEAVDDPLGWHPMDDLAPASMRRRRLIDVSETDDGRLDVLVRFRDSYWEDDGTETVVHEYAVVVGVDPGSWTITAVEAVPGPLPAPECPSAAASGQRLVGQAVGGLRSLVRDTFTGTTTCTHLNDVFRSLADVEHLWQLRI